MKQLGRQFSRNQASFRGFWSSTSGLSPPHDSLGGEPLHPTFKGAPHCVKVDGAEFSE